MTFSMCEKDRPSRGSVTPLMRRASRRGCRKGAESAPRFLRIGAASSRPPRPARALHVAPRLLSLLKKTLSSAPAHGPAGPRDDVAKSAGHVPLRRDLHGL